MFYTKILIYDKGHDFEELEKLGLTVDGEEKWVDFGILLNSIIGFRPYNDNTQVCIYVNGDSFVLPYSFEEFKEIYETQK